MKPTPVFLNTCSVRDNAEQKIIHRLEALHALRKKGRRLILGVLGCMAERVKDDLLAKHHADLVAGPDAYLSLPDLVAQAEVGQKGHQHRPLAHRNLRRRVPERFCGSKISGFVSITRGCNNFCHYCIVPYTRGRERSRDVQSIINECRDLEKRGFKEVTLLGQNVNSYKARRNATGETERPTSALAKRQHAMPPSPRNTSAPPRTRRMPTPILSSSPNCSALWHALCRACASAFPHRTPRT